jgi:CRP-like cAMP-binding protein
MTDTAFLRQAQIFLQLDDSQLARIIPCCSEQTFQNGEKLFSEREPAQHLWLLKDGAIDLRFELPGHETSQENTVSTISSTVVFGWSSLVPPQIYTLSAYCTSRTCTAVKIETAELNKLFDEDPRMGYLIKSYLLRVVGSRFHILQQSTAHAPFAKVMITVHLGTCGIAAGARNVMTALTDEIAKSSRKDIAIESDGCRGDCNTEPQVTVTISGEEPVVYGRLTPDDARQIFNGHIQKGEIQRKLVV